MSDIVNQILCLIIPFINFLLRILFGWWIDLIIFILQFLPPSPFEFEPVQWGEFGKAVGYFIPVAKMINHFALLLVSITIWYAVQHILRILRMVR
ncbi:MAG TPA: hypothetical protein VFX18_06110 [Candidatus Nitrosocosmicus sp.]|nr:hypothetical protein [Candidatus Nitrosocosmicus sp.]